MDGLKRWLRKRISLAADAIITLLGGATQDDLRRAELDRFTEAAHIYRRTQTMTYHKAVSEGQLFNPRAKPRSKVLQFIVDLNGTDRWLAVPVTRRQAYA